MSGLSRMPDLDEWDPFEPVSEPGIGTAPPRKPPTAVGAGTPDDGGEPRAPRGGDHWELTWLLRMVISQLDQPLADVGLAPDVVETLSAGGVTTVAQLLGLTDRRLRQLGVDAETRKRVTSWRRQVGIAPRR